MLYVPDGSTAKGARVIARLPSDGTTLGDAGFLLRGILDETLSKKLCQYVSDGSSTLKPEVSTVLSSDFAGM